MHLETQHAATDFQNNEKLCSLRFSAKKNILDDLLFEKEEIKINYISNVILQLYCFLSGVLFNYLDFFDSEILQ